MPGPGATHTNALELDAEELARIAACPRCKATLALVPGRPAECDRCGSSYPALAHSWDLRLPREELDAPAWETWDGVQANGVVGYAQDPERNIAVGERGDAAAFARFCELHGLVLDVGCGPQAWPSYFRDEQAGTRFVGVDPLVGDAPAGYLQLRALAEHLPFRDASFDHVLFATTLDHFVDPRAALHEATRVLKPGGTIEAWVGHKRPDAPAPASSPDWYRKLTRPQGAEDLFHIKRLAAEDSEGLLEGAGLRIVAREDIEVDEYRSNHFFKAAPAG